MTPQLTFPTLSFGQVLIVGAGKMSRLLVKHLESKGCNQVTLVNRSRESAEALAAEFPDVKFDIRLSPELLTCVSEADVIFTASSSVDPLIYRKDLEAMPKAPALVREQASHAAAEPRERDCAFLCEPLMVVSPLWADAAAHRSTPHRLAACAGCSTSPSRATSPRT